MYQLKCDYCNTATRLAKGNEIYPHRPDLASLNFYLCDSCGAYVGCHKNGDGKRPLGRVANAELRKAKSKAHAAFDPLWKSGKITRGAAYSALAKSMGIYKEQCHIGMFDVEQCEYVVAWCEEFYL
ncbi:DUF3268 family zinc-finger domain-containing protein [Escherichia coli]|uniref:zinc-finger-containing protein n=1 Tax=Escherichia coli TaxID=562 RepID=UPI001F56E2BE|nr:zinc-finger-containing protein [Escherichia coli]MCI2234019.1 DUF3268 family zinc-finger domain-containing protein [Escherichia coli]